MKILLVVYIKTAFIIQAKILGSDTEGELLKRIFSRSYCRCKIKSKKKMNSFH